jgi:uncharacterized protein (TIRG00374 family)
LANKWKWLRAGFGLGLLCILLWMVDFWQLGAALHTVDARSVCAAAVLLIIVAMLGALNLQMLFNTEGQLPFRIFLPVFWTSWAIGQVFPGQIGDMVSLAAMLKRRGLDLSASIGRSLVDKLVSLTLMVSFAAWAIESRLSPSTASTLAVIALVLAALALLFREGIVRLLLAPKSKAGRFVLAVCQEAHSVATRYPMLVLLNIFITTVKIFLTGAAYLCMFRAFGADHAHLWSVTTTLAISSLVAYIPISFNGMGTAEAAGIMTFATLGVTKTAVLGSFLILRAINIAIAWVPAAIWLMFVRRPG